MHSISLHVHQSNLQKGNKKQNTNPPTRRLNGTKCKEETKQKLTQIRTITFRVHRWNIARKCNSCKFVSIFWFSPRETRLGRVIWRLFFITVPLRKDFPNNLFSLIQVRPYKNVAGVPVQNATDVLGTDRYSYKKKSPYEKSIPSLKSNSPK